MVSMPGGWPHTAGLRGSCSAPPLLPRQRRRRSARGGNDRRQRRTTGGRPGGGQARAARARAVGRSRGRAENQPRATPRCGGQPLARPCRSKIAQHRWPTASAFAPSACDEYWALTVSPLPAAQEAAWLHAAPALAASQSLRARVVSGAGWRRLDAGPGGLSSTVFAGLGSQAARARSRR
ncbi:unnamed protein product [Prorocentrum cordatum]|uniref:Uncharacterized protein n=1 Tax=Prorocentrum cordatum TaxID=2364126 RepID=A0ABN9YHN6_9DINO|nr:unnamed protein product [Polarella glacialis]